ncbi:sugar phosphate isomerase/epimerase family protein [Ammoniphilus sp. CFH 90114]|uniref:sugar phosphate isomerase/epimerase family protein n=1 Tax=Ammoniphilus sp. CFH 90114 TaxID=2493665 RepID=UPI0013E99067|nr:sugar phosphate isomerase/epimerase family protein [Ammoniphilus sp. CFH 90114]
MITKRLNYAVTGGGERVHRAAPVLFKGDLYQSIDLAKTIGYDAIEWHINDPNEVDGEQLKAYCDRMGFSISAFVTGMGYTLDRLSLIDDSDEGRAKAVQRLKACIDLAEQLECMVIIGYMRGNIPDLEVSSKYKQYLVDSLTQLTDYAQEKGVVLAIEVINRYEVNYLNTIEETAKLIEEVGSEFLKIHIDTFHMNIEETDFVESILSCQDQLGYVHVADSNRRAPGMGHINFASIIEVLKQIGYDGYVSLECLYDQDPSETAKQGLTYLKSIEDNIKREESPVHESNQPCVRQ